MRRPIALVAAVVLVGLWCGCGRNDAGSPGSADSGAVSPDQARAAGTTRKNPPRPPQPGQR